MDLKHLRDNLDPTKVHPRCPIDSKYFLMGVPRATYILYTTLLVCKDIC